MAHKAYTPVFWTLNSLILLSELPIELQKKYFFTPFAYDTPLKDNNFADTVTNICWIKGMEKQRDWDDFLMSKPTEKE